MKNTTKFEFIPFKKRDERRKVNRLIFSNFLVLLHKLLFLNQINESENSKNRII